MRRARGANDRIDDDSRVHAIAEEIERYLATHPDCCDTLEGIQRWWIPRQRLEESLERTRAAVAMLERDGVVERIDSGGRVTFRLRGRAGEKS